MLSTATVHQRAIRKFRCGEATVLGEGLEPKSNSNQVVQLVESPDGFGDEMMMSHRHEIDGGERRHHFVPCGKWGRPPPL